MTLRDVIVLAVVLACVGALDRYVVPDAYKWIFRAVVALLAVLWLLNAVGVLDRSLTG